MALNLPFNESEEMIVNGIFVIVEFCNNDGVNLVIAFIPVESQRFRSRAVPEK